MSDQEHQVDGSSTPAEGQRPGRSAVFAVAAAVAVLVGAFAGVVIAHGFPSGAHSETGARNGRSSIADKAARAVVDLAVSFAYDGSTGHATGIVVTPAGEVLTNNHIIDGATGIT